MIVFGSMTTISALTAVTVALLVGYGTARQPLAAAAAFVTKLYRSPKKLILFLSLLLIMALNKFELNLEAALPVPRDLTRMLVGWEGSWQGTLQRALESPWLTIFCAFFYLVVFQGFMVASLILYASAGKDKLYYALCIALLLNYLVAVPFYLFVPVHEAWAASPNIRFLMLDAFPSFETQYRRLSGLDNCFPSLHTSISVTMALLALRSGSRRWAIFGVANAVIIVFSIFYLGIHWATDMFAGIVLAASAVAIGLKVGAWADRPAVRRKRQPRIQDEFKKLAPTRMTDS
ncbi:phosphatase PAP2 family protein [Cohnella ginsengisoli]|uniref:Phosphatase PAP2 family protein n=1 Tax=Cohnella ginsengisoli TaxID=425004 RepID=A0A9X4KE78_9BACL|nr:phosphatase PAP2 family protein [Cohnella ginsengisoli]MDG0790156.1 phosphatase PAP2 family protein [Cohnella ginsengisoli]